MFMPRELTNFEDDSEMLEMNMANITNELSEMIVGAPSTPRSVAMNDWMQPDVEGGHDAIVNGANFAMTGRRLVVPIQEHAYFSNIEELCYSYESFRHSKLGNAIQPARLEGMTSPRAISSVKQRAHSIDLSAFELSQMPRRFVTGTRYKRRASATDVESHEALICCAAIDERTPDSLYACTQTKRSRSTSVRRKFTRIESNEPIDYNSVVIDLKAIGLSTEKENNDVLRLFAVFRKFHYYLNDVIPSSHVQPDLMDYPKKFVKPVNPMPCTMNVQSQIKHAIHKSNAFCYLLFDKLDELKLADRDKYVECSRSLFVLRKMIKKLELFKNAELEHKHGFFVNSFGAAQAKNLEILLLQTISKIRECNIYVEVYIWSVHKNVQTNDLPSLETLKKAVAIAGAILKYSSNTPIENKNEMEMTDEIKTAEDVSEVNRCNDNGRGNGGGFGRIAIIPAPLFESRENRYVGV